MHSCVSACRRVGGRYGICASTSAGCPSKKYGCVSPSGFTPPGANLRAANRTLSPHAVPNQTVEVAKTEASALIALQSAMERLVEYRRYEQSIAETVRHAESLHGSVVAASPRAAEENLEEDRPVAREVEVALCKQRIRRRLLRGTRRRVAS